MLDAKLIRFLIVGMVNTLIGLLIIYAAKVMGAGDVVANGVGYGAGIAIGFYLNKQWTFAYSRRTLPAFFRFLLVTGAAYTANLGVVLLAINALAYNAYVAQALGIPVFTLINYLGSRYFTFREVGNPSEAPDFGGDARDAISKDSARAMLISRFGRTTLGVGILLLLAPVAFYFWASLAGLHSVLRYAAVVVCIFILGFGCYLLRAYVAQLRRVGTAICLTLFVGGVIVVSNRADVFPGPFDVQLLDHGMSGTERLNPTLTHVWGKSLQVYSIAPQEGKQSALVLRFPYAPSQVRLFLTGDPGSWKSASMQGAHTLMVELTTAGDGSHSQVRVVTVPINDLGGSSWIVNSLPFAAKASGEMRLTMKLLGPNGDMSGPPVVMAVQAYGMLAWLSAAGKALLTGLALGIIGLSFAPTIQSRTLTASSYESRLGWRSIWRRLAASALFVLLLGGLVYWSSANSNYVFFWDYRNYWSLTEQLYEKMAVGDWAQAVNAFIALYPSDYSMLPAVIPALLSLLVGYPGKTVYAVLITVVYAAPALLMTAYCAERLTSPAQARAMLAARSGFLPSAVIVLIGYPAFLGVVLLMMPDIGGVVLVSAAMLLAHELAMRLVTPANGEGRWYLTAPFVKVCLALGVVHFRRCRYRGCDIPHVSIPHVDGWSMPSDYTNPRVCRLCACSHGIYAAVGARDLRLG
jgi:putative flippase GtrA